MVTKDETANAQTLSWSIDKKSKMMPVTVIT